VTESPAPGVHPHYDAGMTTTTRETADPTRAIETRMRDAIASALPGIDPGTIDPLVGPSRQPELGDFQSNAAMPLAKRLGSNPRELAAKIVAHADMGAVAEPLNEDSIAGPGFINITLRTAALGAALDAMDDDALGVGAPERVRTIVVDLCGVNLAKQMHVGHLRSTVIGDAIARLKERQGHRVIRQSHVGDWGLPIAMVVEELIARQDAGELDPASITLDGLNTIYRAAQSRCRAEREALKLIEGVGGHAKAQIELAMRIEHADEAMERAKSRLVALQSGDERSVAAWRVLYDITMGACLETCARLHASITDEHSAGESTYRDELAPLVEDLIERGIAQEDGGALVVRVEGTKEPALVRKRDGGFLYATTDLAAIRRRVQKLGADEVVYCVDARQALHFKQVFGAALRAGYADREDGSKAQLVHAAFGNVLGEDNKPLKTRSGENVKLTDLLDEAQARARAQVDERSPGLDGEERAAIAGAVAMAAVKYADLSTERVKDYVFSLDRMLAFEGDTGPYILYAIARIKNLMRKAGERGVDASTLGGAAFALDGTHERRLALLTLRYPSVLGAAADHEEPNRLCGYLYDLATHFAKFYEHCPVLRSDVDDATRRGRLRLAALTLRVLEDGARSLGIPTVDRM